MRRNIDAKLSGYPPTEYEFDEEELKKSSEYEDEFVKKLESGGCTVSIASSIAFLGKPIYIVSGGGLKSKQFAPWGLLEDSFEKILNEQLPLMEYCATAMTGVSLTGQLDVPGLLREVMLKRGAKNEN